MNNTRAIALATAVALSPLSLLPAVMDNHGAIAYADSCYAGDWSPMACPPSINLTDIPDIDTLPICAEEDCSDRPKQTGLWPNDGNWYLERGEGRAWLVIDNTVTL